MQRIVNGRLVGEHNQLNGDKLRMHLQGRQNEVMHQSPQMGKIYTIEGDEGADLKRHHADGEVTGIGYRGNGGLGIQHAPGDAMPRAAAFANAGLDATAQQPGEAPKGVGLRMKGDLYRDPNRNVNHVERDLDGGFIGMGPVPVGAALI